MHRRIVVVVSMVLFALLAAAAAVQSNLHDASSPERLGVRAVATLDFTRSQLGSDEAFAELRAQSDRLGLGLVKLAPDLTGDQSGQVFVTVGSVSDLPARVRRFGDQPDAVVKPRAALQHSYPSGMYFVTGSPQNVPQFQRWLGRKGVASDWHENGLGATLELVRMQSSFVTSLLAATALMVALVLYWLSVKAKGRALRALSGVSTWRIQAEDLSGFLLPVLMAAVICGVPAVTYVGASQGRVFVPFYATTLLIFDGMVVAGTTVFAAAMSMASWPSPQMLARREPAVKSLRRTSVVLKGAVFLLVMGSVAPAAVAYRTAHSLAHQQARWKTLADQVALSFSMDESGFQKIMPGVGRVVRDAQEKKMVALSYTWDEQFLEESHVDVGHHDALAIVNPKWVELMSGGAPGADGMEALVPLAQSDVPQGVRRWLGPEVELWSRDKETGEQALSRGAFYRFRTPNAMPLAGVGGGDLLFPRDAIVLVVPDIYAAFDDDFLASAASANNVLFTGLDPTQKLVEAQALPRTVDVKYAAEEGILVAQFAANFAWMQAVALVGLVVALVVSALIAAFITAVLKARRDFPLRLSGSSWQAVLGDRIVAEWVVGGAIVAMVVMLRGGSDAAIIVPAALLALLASPVAHLLAARWTFDNVSRRRL